MSLFQRKKEEAKAPVCACKGGCSGSETAEAEPAAGCCGEAVSGICSIRVLGSGCKSCHALLEAATEAVEQMGLRCEVEYVTDMRKIMEYGVMRMPALVVNEQVVCAGRVLKTADVTEILRNL